MSVKAGPLRKKLFRFFFPFDTNTYLRSCEIMLSVGKVVILQYLAKNLLLGNFFCQNQFAAILTLKNALVVGPLKNNFFGYGSGFYKVSHQTIESGKA